jgi:MFS family permease
MIKAQTEATMNQRERQGWFIVATLFLVLFLIVGAAYGTIGVFVPALLKAFPDWSRAKVSLLPSVMAFSAGAAVLPIGWLLDRVEARIVMTFGAIAAGGAFLIASRSDSFAPLIAAYLLLGVGLSGATVGPAAFVIANWFEARRGLAMGIALAGVSAGVMAATLLSNFVIQARGWRAAYVVVGVPIILLLVPLITFVVRSRPQGSLGAAQRSRTASGAKRNEQTSLRGTDRTGESAAWAYEEKMTVAQGAKLLEGFEVIEALRVRSFWMLLVANLCFAIAASGTVVHLIAYLREIGYKANTAALSMSILAGLAAFDKLGMGHIADRIGARLTLAFNFAAGALAFLLLLSASRVLLLILFVLAAGVAIYAPLVLLPLLLAESLGRRRYGVLGAFIGIAHTFGLAIGPVAAGRIFDVTGSYAGAFELFMILNAIGATAAFACQPYAESAQVKLAPAATSA